MLRFELTSPCSCQLRWLGQCLVVSQPGMGLGVAVAASASPLWLLSTSSCYAAKWMHSVTA
jgi:hypothetical protein